VAAGVVASVLLTTVLVVLDHENDAAASSSPANAQRDALAVTTLHDLASQLAQADAVRAEGIVGLRQIQFRELDLLVADLGGTLETTSNQWSLALDGGWSCLRWAHGGPWNGHVTRGVCPNTPIVTTPVFPARTYALAQRQVAAQEGTVVDASR
jgi:hypothetical protein